jgi:hypothetical protein
MTTGKKMVSFAQLFHGERPCFDSRPAIKTIVFSYCASISIKTVTKCSTKTSREGGFDVTTIGARKYKKSALPTDIPNCMLQPKKIFD